MKPPGLRRCLATKAVVTAGDAAAADAAGGGGWGSVGGNGGRTVRCDSDVRVVICLPQQYGVS